MVIDGSQVTLGETIYDGDFARVIIHHLCDLCDLW